MTHGHDKPYQGTHIINDAARTGAVLPKPVRILSREQGDHAFDARKGGGRTRLDTTHGSNMPYLGAHVTNSAERTDTMLPNPCTIQVKGNC
jgi:hypothetical protein